MQGLGEYVERRGREGESVGNDGGYGSGINQMAATVLKESGVNLVEGEGSDGKACRRAFQ